MRSAQASDRVYKYVRMLLGVLLVKTIIIWYFTGIIIPQDIIEINKITSSAKWILLIEKDAAFQQIVQDNYLGQLGRVICITVS